MKDFQKKVHVPFHHKGTASFFCDKKSNFCVLLFFGMFSYALRFVLLTIQWVLLNTKECCMTKISQIWFFPENLVIFVKNASFAIPIDF